VRDPGLGTALPATPRAEAPARAAGGAVELAGVRLTHPGKVLYAEQGLTKLDLAQYYVTIADHMLPHLSGRPLTLVRCPEGRHRSCFYQKHVGEGLAAELRRIEIAEKDGTGTYLIAEDAPGLVALVQMGVLEIHVWGSTRRALERPDRIVLDLDPDEGLPWTRVVEAAFATRALLEEMGLQSFAKATGGKGLHVVVPIRPKHDWDEIKRLTQAIAQELVRRAPAAYTASLSKKARRGKVFVDYLRNQRGATAIAPFSARAKPGATVAAPLDWREVEAGLRGDRFTVANLPERLASLAEDPWRGMAGLRQSIPAAIARKLRGR
jgi:bifunctional non-homologous end joining protein LigD